MRRTMAVTQVMLWVFAATVAVFAVVQMQGLGRWLVAAALLTGLVATGVRVVALLRRAFVPEGQLSKRMEHSEPARRKSKSRRIMVAFWAPSILLFAVCVPAGIIYQPDAAWRQMLLHVIVSIAIGTFVLSVLVGLGAIIYGLKLFLQGRS